MRNFTVRLRNSLSAYIGSKSASLLSLSFILTTQAGCPNIVPEVKDLFDDGNNLVNGLNISSPTSPYFNSSGSTSYTLTYVNTSSISLVPGNVSINTGGTVAGCSGILSGTGPTFIYTINGCTGDGPVSISVAAATALDNSGNPVAGVGPSSTATVDNTGPSISCSNPTGISFSNNITVNQGTCTDSSSGCNFNLCNVDGGAWTSCSFTALSNAAHTFQIQAVDIAGNSTTAGCGAGVTVDNTVLSISSPAANTVFQTTVGISGSCVNGLPVNISGSGVASATPSSPACAANSFSSSVTLSAGDGSKTIDVSQTDTAFAATQNNSINYVKDSTAPTGSSITPALSMVNTSTVGLTLSATDPNLTEMNIGLSCGGGTWVSYSTSATSPILTSNTANTIYAQFRDIVNNTSGCVSTSVTHDNTAPTFPAAVAVTGTPNIIGGTNQTISWTTSDTNLDTTMVTDIEFYDGTSWGLITSVASNNGSNTNYNWTTPTASCNNACQIRVTSKDLVGNTSSNTTGTFSIVGALNHFALSFPGSTTAGVSQTLTVTAQDINNLVLTNYTGTVNFSSNDGQAVLPGSYSFVGGDSGIKTFTGGVTLKTAGLRSITVDNGGGISNTLSSISVNAASPTQLVLTQQPPASATAGQNFTPNIAVEIRDPYNNVVTSASNNITLTTHSDSGCSSASSDILNGTTSLAASSGAATFSNINYDFAESIYIKAYAVGLTQACSSVVSITPEVADHFDVIWGGSTTVSAGDAYDLTVTALDPYNNVDYNYTGTVNFSSNDSQIIGQTLPANYSFIAGDAGTKTFNNVEFRTAGASQYIAADDTPRTGQTLNISVSPASQYQLIITGPGAPPHHADECLAFSVKRVDMYGNNVNNNPSPLAVTMSALMNARVYSDSQCLSDITPNVNISASTAVANFYLYDYVNDSLNFNAAAGLPGGSTNHSITLNPRLPWGNGSDGTRVVTATGTNVNTDTSVIPGRTLSAVRQVTNMPSITGVDVSPTFTGGDFVIGDEVMWMIVAKGQVNNCDASDNYKVGQYGFARIIGASATTMNFDRPFPQMLNNTYLSSTPYIGSNFCRVIVQRVPQFTQLSFSGTGSLTANPLSMGDGTGGIVVFRVKNNLITSTTSYIDVFGKGYNGGLGGSSFQFQGTSSKGIDNTGTINNAFPNFTGGHRGYWTSPGNIGGGGGGNAGYGGMGYNGSGVSSRSNISTGTFNLNNLFFGGGGGGAFHSGAENRKGGSGGGIIMVYANTVSGSGTLFLDAYGEDAFMGTSGGYAGGGGGGGSILAQFYSIGASVTLDKNTKGGRGGDVSGGGATTGGGGGGGGGYIHLDYCSSSGTLLNNIVGRIGGTANGGLNNGESGQSGLYEFNNAFCPN
ncbi:MAG: hypothetical protein IPM57_00230 [Oligoflexia bacterium]|nr:hypothetical protein [Oligoflexia bacterium]